MSDPSPANPCDPFRERISAAIDGELERAEQDALASHLAGCASCRAHRQRLQRLGPLLRGARPRVELVGDPLAALQARLAAEPGEPGASTPSGRLLRYDWATVRVQLIQIAAVVAFVVGSSWLLLQQLGPPERPLGQVTPSPWVDRPSPTPTPTALASAPPTTPAPSPRPSPPPATPSPTSSEAPLPAPPGGWPSPRPSPTPSLVQDPGPTPTPTTSSGDTRVRDPEPVTSPTATPRGPVDLAALERLIDEARSKGTPSEQRPHVLLAVATFDHPRAYAFLGDVLGGALDALPSPDVSRRAAWAALGELGTEAAARTLLGARRRAGPEGRRDAAHLLAALCRLRDDEGAALVGEALGRRTLSEDDRGLLLQALGELARPVTVDAVLAFHGSRQPAWLRRESGRVLGRLGDPRALPPLLASLGERRAVVRQGAAQGLGLLAARAPETAGTGVPALAAAIDDKEPSVRVAVIQGLAESGHLFAVPTLIERLDSEHEPRRDLRARVRDALARLTGVRFADAAAARRWLLGGRPLPLPGGPLLSIQADEGLPQLARRGGRVVFLLDASGSMAPAGKWELARFELIQALENLPATRRGRVGFDVVIFADGTKAVFQDFVSSSQRERVREAVRAVRAEQARQVARTDLGRALQRALAHEEVDTVILLSDGLLDAQQDMEQLLWQVAQENQRRELPVTFHTVHVRGGGKGLALDPQPVDPAHPEDVTFMKRLARESGGLYLRN